MLDSRAPAATAAPALSASTSHITLMGRPFGAPRIHMDENAGGGSDAGPIASTPLPADAPSAFASPSSAASYLAALRHKKAAAPAEPADGEPESTAESAEDPATAEDELAQANDGPAEEPTPGEDPSDAEPEAEPLPPIERPRSWTKDVDEDWKALPRTVQEKIATREQERETAIRRSQNDAAEKLKGLSAKEEQAEQARVQYEGKLKSVVDVLEREQLRDFPDIRSMADIEKMAGDATRLSAEAAALWATDPFAAGPLQAQAQMLQSKLQAWSVHQQKLAAAHTELQQADARQATARQTEWANFVTSENAKAAEHIPELADKAKAADLTSKAATLLSEVGFSDEDLAGFSKGEKVSPYDHRFQRLLFHALKYTAAKAAPPKAAPKPVPPVQRPGITPPRGAQDSEHLKDLTRKLEASGSLKDAIALRAAQTRAAGRRAS
ncbi:MAG: hypothetical protein JWP25_8232 [Bradyrhizobium sp.]|nr:hypothetical protein [Bradyrhizobium sp.]